MTLSREERERLRDHAKYARSHNPSLTWPHDALVVLDDLDAAEKRAEEAEAELEKYARGPKSRAEQDAAWLAVADLQDQILSAEMAEQARTMRRACGLPESEVEDEPRDRLEADRNRWRARAEEMEAVAGELAGALTAVRDWIRDGAGTEANAAEATDAALARYEAVKREEER